MAPPRAAICRVLSFSRRGYTASARTAEAQQQQRAPAMISGAEGGAGPVASAAVVSWMRDPKTGYWVPENRFGADVDAAELRAQLLSRRR